MMEGPLRTSKIEGDSRKCIIASAVVLFFASIAVFQFSLTTDFNNIANVVGGIMGDVRRLQTTTSTPQGFGAFYVTMYVGEPPQAQILQVSTHVDYTTMICPECFHCGSSHFDLPFDPKRSQTATYAQCSDCLDPEARCLQNSNQCLLTSHFLGSLASAVEVQDKVVADCKSTIISDSVPANLNRKQGFNLKFQCVNYVDSQSSLTNMVADGYLSLSTVKSSFLQQMFDAGAISSRIFSLCFRDSKQFQPDGASAGTLRFGEILSPNQFKTPMIYALNSALQVGGTPTGYAVNVRRMYLALGAPKDTLLRVSRSELSMMPVEVATGQAMDVYSHVNGMFGNVVIDPSKPYTLLHSSLMEPFVSAFFNVTGMQYDRNGIPMTPGQFKQLPTIVLQLDSADGDNAGGYVLVGVPGLIGEFDAAHPMDVLVAIPPQRYLIYDADRYFASPIMLFDTTISFLGANVLQGHEVVFDLDRSRIGFAEQNCAEGLSLINSETGKKPVSTNSHTTTNETGLLAQDGNNTLPLTEDGNNTLAPGLSSSPPVSGENATHQEIGATGVSVSSDGDASTVNKSSSVGREFDDSGASSGTGSGDVEAHVMHSFSASKVSGTSSSAAVIDSSSDSSPHNMGLPKPSNTEEQPPRYGPAVTTPYSFAASKTGSSGVAATTPSSSTEPSQSNKKTGGSEMLWLLMASTAFIVGFGVTIVGTRAEHAVHPGARWGRGSVRADDGLSVFDATTVYGGRRQAYDGRSVAGSVYHKPTKQGAYGPPASKQVYASPAYYNKQLNERSTHTTKQVYEKPAITKQVYERPATNTKQVYEGSATTTKQVYEGPPATTKQVYEGPPATTTKQVYEGPSSDPIKSAPSSVEKESHHSIFSKGLFGGGGGGGGKKKREVPSNDGGTVATGWSQNSASHFSGGGGGVKKQKELPGNDGGTVATGWSQNSASHFSYANRSTAQQSQQGGFVNNRAKKGAFGGSQSFHSHNVD